METAVRRRSMSMGGVARTIGRHRRAGLVVLLAILVVAPWAWWSTQLWGLPDVGDPFDVAAFEAERVVDNRNAFIDYSLAASKARTASKALQAQKKPAVRFNKFEDGDWSKADPSWRELLAASGDALADWRAGSEKPDARYYHPEGLSIRTLLPISQELGMLARLAVLEGSRLEAEGDVAGAWGWYRAALRSSRHSGKHGFQIERLIGAAMHDVASKGLTRWASNPRVDAPLLRRALDEVIAIDTMTVPPSETLKLEYQLFVASLSDPNLIDDFLVTNNLGEAGDWCQELKIPDSAKKPIQTARVLMADDYTRSLRVTRLMVANWMAQLDKPTSRRTKLARVDPPIYGPDPGALPASRALPPEELSRWLDSSLLASRYFRGLGRYGFALDRERTRQAKLVVHLADQLYRREHGGPPPSPSALVGPYLKALPEGFDEPPPSAVDKP